MCTTSCIRALYSGCDFLFSVATNVLKHQTIFCYSILVKFQGNSWNRCYCLWMMYEYFKYKCLYMKRFSSHFYKFHSGLVLFFLNILYISIYHVNKLLHCLWLMYYLLFLRDKLGFFVFFVRFLIRSFPVPTSVAWL